jgi:peptidoglycan LD-endopeptidase CwlK
VDTISEARLAQLFPPLAEAVRRMAETLAPESISIRVAQGLRSWADQLTLWSKGRDSGGRIVDPSAVVTHAKPGSSYHNFGLAVDVAPFDGKGQPDWNASHPCWRRIIEVGESLGLYSGSHFVSSSGKPETDMPHFQLTGRFPHSPDDEVLYLFKEGGLQGLWEEVLK